jgi:hypothetical protein
MDGVAWFWAPVSPMQMSNKTMEITNFIYGTLNEYRPSDFRILHDVGASLRSAIILASVLGRHVYGKWKQISITNEDFVSSACSARATGFLVRAVSTGIVLAESFRIALRSIPCFPCKIASGLRLLCAW